jgi:beta-hydroxylase
MSYLFLAGLVVVVILVLVVILSSTASLNYVLSSGLHPCRRVPFPDMELEFKEHGRLEANWRVIRDEALNALAQKKALSARDVSTSLFEPIYEKKAADWKLVMLTFYGEEYEANLHLCPQTAALIACIPRIKYAMFSILEPGVVITKHRGPFRGCLRYHLALQVPRDRENCFIVNDGRRYCWKEGEGILFDDTYEHYVENRTSDTRIVLFCDIQREFDGWVDGLNHTIVNSPLPRYFFSLNAKNERAQFRQR